MRIRQRYFGILGSVFEESRGFGTSITEKAGMRYSRWKPFCDVDVDPAVAIVVQR